MNNRSINRKNYTRLLQVFNPVQFDATRWVAAAKSAGMKYIVFITRHHDGFSNWDTKYSDWKITNTPYGKDVLKMLADECRKQGFARIRAVRFWRNTAAHEGESGRAVGL